MFSGKCKSFQVCDRGSMEQTFFVGVFQRQSQESKVIFSDVYTSLKTIVFLLHSSGLLCFSLHFS